ncbi:hypothetical protein HK098_001728 [Nowakowskiella sp. JEL0407]|nr:hypothetical protein HK098_001728 [Nowakowskiella sp. JEL0407]
MEPTFFWTQLKINKQNDTEDTLTPRFQHSLCVRYSQSSELDSKSSSAATEIVVFGGSNFTGYLRDFYGIDLGSITSKKLIPSIKVDTTESAGRFGIANAAIAVNGNKVYSFGGLSENERISDQLTEFDLDKNTIRTIHTPEFTPKPAPRISATLTFVEEFSNAGPSLYLFGGLTIDQIPRNDLWRFDLESRTWSELSTGHEYSTSEGEVVPERREGHSATFWAGLNQSSRLIVYYGGLTRRKRSEGKDEMVRLDDIVIYDIDKNQWNKIRPLSNCIPLGRSLHTAIILENRLIVFGGWSVHQSKTSDTHIDTTATATNPSYDNNAIISTSSSPKSKKIEFSLKALTKKGKFANTSNSKVFLIDDEKKKRERRGAWRLCNDLLEFDFQTNEWRKLNSPHHSDQKSIHIPSPRAGHKWVHVGGNKIIMFGGTTGRSSQSTQTWLTTNEIWELEINNRIPNQISNPDVAHDNNVILADADEEVEVESGVIEFSDEIKFEVSENFVTPKLERGLKKDGDVFVPVAEKEKEEIDAIDDMFAAKAEPIEENADSIESVGVVEETVKQVDPPIEKMDVTEDTLQGKVLSTERMDVALPESGEDIKKETSVKGSMKTPPKKRIHSKRSSISESTSLAAKNETVEEDIETPKKSLKRVRNDNTPTRKASKSTVKPDIPVTTPATIEPTELSPQKIPDATEQEGQLSEPAPTDLVEFESWMLFDTERLRDEDVRRECHGLPVELKFPFNLLWGAKIDVCGKDLVWYPAICLYYEKCITPSGPKWKMNVHYEGWYDRKYDESIDLFESGEGSSAEEWNSLRIRRRYRETEANNLSQHKHDPERFRFKGYEHHVYSAQSLWGLSKPETTERVAQLLPVVRLKNKSK